MAQPHYLPRKTVLCALGTWRRLRALERAGLLHRHYPLGLRHARYAAPEVAAAVRALDSIPAPAEIPSP